ncbi:phage tail tip lysozyme [Paraburkholderia adhaesiva]|uniref:phage tail tip lysozyme n=1 Tax=Paraburkholderia adhaesiva TaxID=2883244 RepID=UPI001F47C0DE|nr:phage tail tip lysozyme [Paraburkholderia adhaesiva]
MKNTLFQDLTPAIGGLSTALGGLNTFMQAHPDLTAGLFGTLMAASTLGGIMKLTGALGGLKTVLGGVGPMLGFGGAAGGGLASTLGIAGLAAVGGLQVAKAAGLPDVDRRKAAEDIRKGNWWTASAEMNPLDLMRSLTARSEGRTNEQIAEAIAKGANPLETAARAQDKAAQSQLDGARAASQALVDAAKDLANAVSTGAGAAELPAGSGAAPGPAPGSVVTGSAKSAAAAFMKMGWSREQAAGIAANLNIESGLRPNIVGDNGAAYGIGQWHADRQAGFRRVFGHDIRGSSLDEQLAFVNYELTRGREQAAGRALRGARSAGEAGAIVSAKYERPLHVEKETAKRSAAASALYASLPGGAAAGSAAPPAAAPMMTAAYQAGAGASMVNSHNRTDTHIGTVNVYGSDTSDGHAVVADMRDELSQNGLIAGAAYGMS